MVKQIFLIALLFVSLRVSANANFCEVLFTSTQQSSASIETVHRYLNDTLAGLEAMRGTNGLLRDAVWIKNKKDGSYQVATLNSATSPTNMAVDILIQIELLERPEKRKAAENRLNKLIETLSDLEFHPETGLLFSRYASDTEVPIIKDPSVSSIDNLHLALALWTLTQKDPHSKTGKMAQALFSRMDFSVYYDEASGLIGGNLRKQDNGWVRESYNFANLGSEARLLYSAGWAIGLFRKVKNDEVFLGKAFANLKVELYQSSQGPLLKLWDGSAFQLFFPRIFANENLYSSALNRFYVNKGQYMLAEGRRRNISTPAAHSAIRVGTHESKFKGEGSIYRDKGGNIDLVSSDNQDVNDPLLRKLWDGAFAPYALVMAAAAAPTEILPELNRLESLKSGRDSLYKKDLGWMEGYHVTGPLTGQVVAAQLSLNQGMLALSLLQIESADGLSASARALQKNEATRKRMQRFYKLFDDKLNFNIETFAAVKHKMISSFTVFK